MSTQDGSSPETQKLFCLFVCFGRGDIPRDSLRRSFPYVQNNTNYCLLIKNIVSDRFIVDY